MAHFAKLDDNNLVIEINVVDNVNINDLPFPESEPVGIEFLTNWSGGYTNWKQTSYNSNFRKNFACIGGTYDAVRDAFIYPKPYPSWVLNEATCLWEAPVQKPVASNRQYAWDEDNLQWNMISEDVDA